MTWLGFVGIALVTAIPFLAETRHPGIAVAALVLGIAAILASVPA